MSAPPADRVRLLSPDEFAPFVPAAADIYGAAMQRSPSTIDSRRELMRVHLSRPGYLAVAAFDDGDAQQLVGFGYAYRGGPGQWWHDVVAAALDRRIAAEWLTDTYELAEFHVHPNRQGVGIGRALLTLLLQNVPAATVLLSTHDRDSPARALYRSVGFVDLLVGFQFPGSTEIYAVMGRRA